MTPEDQQRFGSQTVRLRDGRLLRLRPLAVEDAQALGAFYAAIPREDVRFYCPHDLNHEEAARNAAAAADPHQIVMALESDGGVIAGYAWVRWNSNTPASGSFGLCVHPAWQNAGAGRLLVFRVMEIAALIGPETVHLTVQKANSRAIHIYRQAGFRIEAEQIRQANPRWGLPEEPEYRMIWSQP